MRTHPGSCVQPRNIAGLLDEAFKLASVVATAVKGFEKAGIWPPNRNVFSDADFIATFLAAVEDRVDLCRNQESKAYEQSTMDISRDVVRPSAADGEACDQGQTLPYASPCIGTSEASQSTPEAACSHPRNVVAQQTTRSSEILTKGDGRCFFF